jgi:hypothetical protein
MSARITFLETAHAVRVLLDEPALTERWDDDSALEMMTVGDLAAHLTRAVSTAAAYLAEADAGLSERLVSPSEYYGAVEGTATAEGPDIQGSLHTGVRERAREAAEVGPEGLRTAWDGAMSELEASLATEPATRTVRVFGDQRMILDDYLVTRTLELVIHADDLANSLELETPALPERATELVIECLVRIAVDRHGPMAVIRAMTRTERDSIRALRVL